MTCNKIAIIVATIIGLLLYPVLSAAAITVTEKLAEAQTADNDANWTSSGTFSIANNALGLCAVSSSDTTGLAQPTLTGGSVATWNVIGTVTFNTIATPENRITVFRGLGTGAASAAVVADFAGDNQSAISWSCWEFTNIDLGGVNGSSAIVQFKTVSTDAAQLITATFDSPIGLTQAVMMWGSSISNRTWTPDSGFSAGTEIATTLPLHELIAQYRVDGADSAPTWNVSGANTLLGGFAIEVKETGGGGGGGGSTPRVRIRKKG